MANVTVRRGHGRRPTRAEVQARKAKIEALLLKEHMSALQIARELDMNISTVNRYVREIRNTYNEVVDDDDRMKFVNESLETHQFLLHEGYKLLEDAKRTIIEPEKRAQAVAKALDTIARGQKVYEDFADKYMKYAGEHLPPGAQLSVTINNIVQTPEWEEMMGFIIDWLESKGLDPVELVDFIEDAREGKRKTKKRTPSGKEAELGRKSTRYEKEYVEEARELLNTVDLVEDDVKDVPETQEEEGEDNPE